MAPCRIDSPTRRANVLASAVIIHAGLGRRFALERIPEHQVELHDVLRPRGGGESHVQKQDGHGQAESSAYVTCHWSITQTSGADQRHQANEGHRACASQRWFETSRDGLSSRRICL
jgi:hypothetical protein